MKTATATPMQDAQDATDTEWAVQVTGLPVFRIPPYNHHQGGVCRRNTGGLFHCKQGRTSGTYYVSVSGGRFLAVSTPSGSAPVPPDQCEIRFDNGVREVWACGELVSSRSVTAGEG
jgi:hypothetical protein